MPPVAGPSSRLAIGPATSATKTIGPATATASATSTTATASSASRADSARVPRPAGGVVAELQHPQLPLQQHRRAGTSTASATSEHAQLGGAGLADRAGQPVHRLPRLEELGAGQHVADEASKNAATPMPIRMKR